MNGKQQLKKNKPLFYVNYLKLNAKNEDNLERSLRPWKEFVITKKYSLVRKKMGSSRLGKARE